MKPLQKPNYMQKSQRKAKKKANKEGIKLFCNSLKKQMLHSNKKGMSINIHMSQSTEESTQAGSGDYIEYQQGNRTITVIIESKL